VRLLLDTQALLYWVMGLDALGPQALTLMEDRTNRLFFSIAGAWELSIKVSIGRLNLGRPVGDFLTLIKDEYDIELLAVTPEHVAQVATLPLHHRDPLAIIYLTHLFDSRLIR
jgi:PIN domain nuclease of toxin-antitoxin system